MRGHAGLAKCITFFAFRTPVAGLTHFQMPLQNQNLPQLFLDRGTITVVAPFVTEMSSQGGHQTLCSETLQRHRA